MTAKFQDNPTCLTEFAPLSPGSKSSSGFFSKLFKRNTDNGAEPPLQEPADASSSEPLEAGHSEDCSEQDESVGEVSTSEDSQHRTLSSVLRRLSTILDTRGTTPQVYKDSDFKQYWMPDRHCKECYECGHRFNTFRRRHHCRICGQIFCSRCCNQEVPGKIMGYTGFLRVCTYCCKVVLSYAQNLGVSGDLETFGADLHRHMVAAATAPSTTGPQGSQTGHRHQHALASTIFDEDSSAQVKNDAIIDGEIGNPFDADIYQELQETFKQERKLMLQDSRQLREICLGLLCPQSGVELQSHRHRLRTYHGCVVGKEAVDWLLDRDHATDREQAVAIGQALLDACWIECVSSHQQIFVDEYALYRPKQMCLEDLSSGPKQVGESSTTTEDNEEDTAPLWFRKIERNEQLEDADLNYLSELSKIPATVSVPENLDVNKSVFYVETPSPSPEPRHRPTLRQVSSGDADRQPPVPSVYKDNASIALHHDTDCELPAFTGSQRVASGGHTEVAGVLTPADTLRDDEGDRHAYDRLRASHRAHLSSLARQQVSRLALSPRWAAIVLSLARRVTAQVQPHVRARGDDMDIRQYVLVKKVPGGTRSQSSIISGVACTKNIAHKHMRNVFIHPKILLLRAPIEYQRVENKFSSLEPQILQEHEYLKNCVARIAALEPDLLLVEKTVSRLAQDFILDAGITLILNVKPSVMERVSRFTQADIVTSIDGLVSKKALGQCQSVKTQTFFYGEGRQKTLLYFDGCPGDLGCTVILRGASNKELSKVKQILHFMVYASYHCKLEISLLMDEFALPPSSDEVSLTQDTDCDSAHPDPQGPPKLEPPHPDPPMSSEEQVPEESSPSGISCEVSPPELAGDVVRCGREDVRPVEILDHSDPLQNYQLSRDESIFHSDKEHSLQEIKNSTNNFKSALSDLILSVSPHVIYDIPYLETEQGRTCKLRKYFPGEIFWSKQLDEDPDLPVLSETSNDVLEDDVKEKPQMYNADPHPFVTAKLTATASNTHVQGLLADFRACGGRIVDGPGPPGHNHTQDRREHSPCVWGPQVDCLDPTRHQRLAVLFSSFSYESANAPNPCVSPWVVTMDFYGRNDITLGGFLERYCFRETYRCPSKSCETPMVDHIRRFVHEHGSIHVILKKLDASMPVYENSILMWEWCRVCKEVTPVVPMSPETWSLSFAKYLELRFHATVYGKRSNVAKCGHNLHQQHFTYFGFNDIVASFKYFPINLKEVHLPCVTVEIDRLEVCTQHWENQFLTLTNKGASVISSVLDHVTRLEAEAPSDMDPLASELHTLVKDDQDHVRGALEELQALLRERRQPHSDHTDGHTDGHTETNTDSCSESHTEDQQGAALTDSITPDPNQTPTTTESGTEDDVPTPSQQQDHSAGDSSVTCTLIDSICRTKKLLADIVIRWNNRILEFEQLQKKNEKEKTRNQIFPSKKDAQGSTEMLHEYSETGSPSQVEDDLGEDREDATDNRGPQSLPTPHLASYSPNSGEVTTHSLQHGNEAPQHGKETTHSPQHGKETTHSPQHAKETTHSPQHGKETTHSPQHAKETTHSPQHGNETTHSPQHAIETSHSPQHGNETTNSPQHANETSHSPKHGNKTNLPQDLPAPSGPEDPPSDHSLALDPGHFASSPGAQKGSSSPERVPQHGTNSQGWSPQRSRPPSKPGSVDDLDATDWGPRPSPVHTPHRAGRALRHGLGLPREGSSTDLDKKLVKTPNFLANLLSGAGTNAIQMPFSPEEHHVLTHAVVCKETIPIIIYDQEPSSIIAYTLSTTDYEVKLQQLVAANQCRTDQAQMSSSHSGRRDGAQLYQESQFLDPSDQAGRRNTMLAFFRGVGRDKSPSHQTIGQPGAPAYDIESVRYTPRGPGSLEDSEECDMQTAVLESEGPSLGSSSRSSKQTTHHSSQHIELQFSDSTANFYCKVYFADQFRKLRNLIFPAGEERYIRSLSRCFTWLAAGGKSGSSFCKTQDDRFILKQMSRYEIQSFTKFAPHYINYITEAHNEQKPTVLAKILGVYRTGYRNTQTIPVSESKQDVLVMENLFYGRNINQIFDLKGSLRNRLVTTMGKRVEELVLLDENLLKSSVDCPLYIRPHSKTVLTLAITNDTEFLAKQLIMDYSLLVGVDDERGDLVLGIIDYIRTFTWDKKLEMVVKNYIGGQGKMPTVVYPESYRSRFLQSMDRYFLPVPDRWAGLGRDVDC